ncbi:MAG: HEAT repeat domain-containing protein [Planctomycetaceae bacterium]
MICRITLVFSLVLLPSLTFAKPPSREESDRQSQVLKQLKESVAGATTDAGKLAAITQVLTDESDVDLRRRIVDIATTAIHGRILEEFLIARPTTEKDAGLRSQAATALGQTGSEDCLAVLAKVAAYDQITSNQIGDIRIRSSARRAAIFALAQLAERFPKLADRAADELRTVPATPDPKDKESLSDARRQALYRITHDETLLQPFFDQLKSDDPKEREKGIVAFRFLKLKKAPPEVVHTLQDPSVEVRSWAALVLGEIGDRNTVAPLVKLAEDSRMERRVRCNAIGALGRMRAENAAELMKKLLSDQDVSTNAAIALYRITGEKTKQFPDGYNAD